MANTLCIDIGGTRIKAAVLREQSTLADLEKANIKVMETLGWLNSSLPQIVSKDHWASLTHPYKGLEHYDKVSVSVPFKISEDGKSVDNQFANKYGVPQNLAEALSSRVNCEVSMMNDGIAWMRGALKYFKLCSAKIEMPCLAVILGTGVGLAYSESDIAVKGIEISEQDYVFKNLSDNTNDYINNGGKVHKVLGSKFYQEVKENYKKWSYIKIRNEYTERLIGLFKDIEEANLFNFKEVKTIVMGGGNTEYICLSNLKCSVNKPIYIFSRNHISINTINPDVIPLLGLLP